MYTRPVVFRIDPLLRSTSMPFVGIQRRLSRCNILLLPPLFVGNSGRVIVFCLPHLTSGNIINKCILDFFFFISAQPPSPPHNIGRYANDDSSSPLFISPSFSRSHCLYGRGFSATWRGKVRRALKFAPFKVRCMHGEAGVAPL